MSFKSAVTVFICFIALFTAFPAWSGGWEIAPAGEFAVPETSASQEFVPIKQNQPINSFLTGNEGWFWLRKEIKIKSDNMCLMLQPPKLAWRAWWNNKNIAASGFGQPKMGASRQIPGIYELPESPEEKSVLLIKVYSVMGQKEKVPAVFVETKSEINKIFIITLIKQTILPCLAALAGLIMLIMGFVRLKTLKGNQKILNPAFTGFTGIAVFMLTPLSFISALPHYLNWHVFILISSAALPLLISSWRRSIVSTRCRETAYLCNDRSGSAERRFADGCRRRGFQCVDFVCYR